MTTEDLKYMITGSYVRRKGTEDISELLRNNGNEIQLNDLFNDQAPYFKSTEDIDFLEPIPLSKNILIDTGASERESNVFQYYAGWAIVHNEEEQSWTINDPWGTIIRKIEYIHEVQLLMLGYANKKMKIS